jgi:DNA-binding NtrC family response regulator
LQQAGPFAAREEGVGVSGGQRRSPDDEEALAEMGEEMLSSLGYDAIARTGSRDALELLNADPHSFDLAITDQTMPDMTGVELAKEILAVRADMAITLCTGFSHLVDADKAKAAGGNLQLAQAQRCEIGA